MPHEDAMITREMRECARICHECHDACLELIPHCLSLGGAHAEAEHIVLLLDCAAICRTSEDFLHRGSGRHDITCGACAEICDQCADDCDRFADDGAMRQCAELCRECAQSCRELAGVRSQR